MENKLPLNTTVLLFLVMRGEVKVISAVPHGDHYDMVIAVRHEFPVDVFESMLNGDRYAWDLTKLGQILATETAPIFKVSTRHILPVLREPYMQEKLEGWEQLNEADLEAPIILVEVTFTNRRSTFVCIEGHKLVAKAESMGRFRLPAVVIPSRLEQKIRILGGGINRIAKDGEAGYGVLAYE